MENLNKFDILEDTTVSPNEVIKRKLRENFNGKIVRKDLTKKIKEGANVPVYVLEFLLGQYCNTDDEEFKKQAIKLAKEVGNQAAATELGIPKGTIGTWLKKAREGEIDTGVGTRTPGESLNLAQQLQAANKRIRELEKKNRELEELNEFLEEASAFFAANRRKSGKKND